MKNCITSWDDGHPLDLRVAELLLEYKLGGIFFIPINNAEGLPTLKPNQIRWLAEHFLIGGHTYNHLDLTTLSEKKACQEIKDGKDALEQIVGKSVTAFCYPRGHYTKKHQTMVQQAGFDWARSARLISSHHGQSKQNRFAVHPHLHFYPHSSQTYAAHSIKHRDLNTLLASTKLWSRFDSPSIVNFSQMVSSSYFHLWGHSWEIDAHNHWQLLESTLAQLAENRDYES